MGENMLTVLREMLDSVRRNGYQESVVAISTVIGDLQRVNKDYVSREDLLKYIKSQNKAIEVTASKAKELGIEYTPDFAFTELLDELWERYAPKMPSEADYMACFKTILLVHPDANKGELMRQLRIMAQNTPYDGKLAAQVADRVLKESGK